ncbi:MAG: symmetrical bis(5'-nucleosyl)-tetraphosphatase [Gammaproteobacteria bacterium]|nr:symmetrical bis(5'-nucleosyl)-tetraphosphatase [Gammaproteobacteria bacterium]
MTDYAIGDIQGCYDPLMRLLTHIEFDAHKDTLWLVGDLVNRGPDSLKVLRFIQALPIPPRISLGNHDLHLLCQIFLPHQSPQPDDTLSAILNAPDKKSLGDWLRQQPLLQHDQTLNVVMTHAGIAPTWTLEQAKTYAAQLETVLCGADYLDFLTHMYGNTPNYLSENDTETERLRVICNSFTRMRFCDTAGHLELTAKTKPEQAPQNCYPWYALPTRKPIQADLVFGHWAALQGMCPTPHIHAIDTGCVWGGPLSALRLQDKKRFSVPGL